jgi:hypothetical protein
VIARYALEYASKGWNAVVTVDDEFVRVVAVPEHGIDPKKYVLGLLQHRYLDDALPILEALYSMVDDAEIAYNYSTGLVFDLPNYYTIAILPGNASADAHCETAACAVPQELINISSVSFYSVDFARKTCGQWDHIPFGG